MLLGHEDMHVYRNIVAAVGFHLKCFGRTLKGHLQSIYLNFQQIICFGWIPNEQDISYLVKDKKWCDMDLPRSAISYIDSLRSNSRERGCDNSDICLLETAEI